MEAARGCFRHLRTMFTELEECRAFELLKGQARSAGALSACRCCLAISLQRRMFQNGACFSGSSRWKQHELKVQAYANFTPAFVHCSFWSGAHTNPKSFPLPPPRRPTA